MYDFSFNQSLDSSDNLLDEIIKTVTEDINKTKTNQNKLNQKYLDNEKKIIKKIINSLYASYYSIPKSWVSISLRAKDYSKGLFSYRAARRIFDGLIKNKYIIYKYGSESSRKVTRIYPSKKLVILFKRLGHLWRKYDVGDAETVIIREKTKDGKRVTVTTPNNNKAKTIRNNLRFINEELSKHCLALDIDDEAYLFLEKHLKKQTRKNVKENFWNEKTPYAINYSRFKLVRIFSDKSLSLHGRFYGGWWQSLSEKFRQHITIDGRQTLEIDYSTLALRMIYALENKTLNDTKDPFELGINPNKEQRKLIKKFTYALINDTKGNYRLPKNSYKKLNLTHNELVNLIKQHHPPIVKYLKSKIGLKLMYLDSVIAEDIILSLIKKGIVVLPIHDSFIVARKFVGELAKQMNISFKKVLKQNPKFDISSPRWRIDFYKALDEDTEPLESFSSKGYDILSGRNSKIYLKYFFSWKKWSEKNT